MMLRRLLGIGLAYGFGFMFVKSLFPEPFVLLILQGGQSSEGDLTTLALVYMGVGLLAGLIAGPVPRSGGGRWPASCGSRRPPWRAQGSA